EAGMRLWMLVGRARLGQLAGERVDIIVTLARTIDAVGPVQAGVEPLRAVWSNALRGQHVGPRVHESLRIGFRVEMAAFPAPVGPRAGRAREDLTGVGFGTVTLILGEGGQRLFIGHGAPEEGRDVIFLN